MWDVKNDARQNANRKDYSFISTMWDVKYFIGQHKGECTESFISTMWDVKYETAITMDGQIVFYLDYVGCKGD